MKRCLGTGGLRAGSGEEGRGHFSLEAAKVHGREPSEGLGFVWGSRGG